MSLWTRVPQSGPAPCDRYKHACCAQGDDIYLLGGRRQGRLNDFWRYSAASSEWTELDCSSEEAPKELEEHTMVTHQGFLYVFGGMIDSAYTEGKTSLWLYDIDKKQWARWQGAHSKSGVPVNRWGHSAVVYESAMHVYGGYIDMKGSTQEFWMFDFDCGQWSSLLPPLGDAGPGPRHGHSAVVHRDGMYLYGGLMGLREQSDFWKWNFCSQSWSSVKAFSGPSKLVGHSAVRYEDSMLLFGGGETHSFPKNSLWRFSFTSQTWEKLSTAADASPPARIYHCSTGLGPGFRAKGSTAPSPGPSPGSTEKQDGLRLRPFKNRCFPSAAMQGAIELDTFCIKNGMDGSGRETSSSGAPERDDRLCPPSLRTSGLTVVNREAFGKDSLSVPEDRVVDLLLVIGGKPLSRRASISVWQLTLADL
ncbi:leucine-zipper-like transcriptional regulator 1 homolog [Lepisosteus oculatus]|uniref:leucine-zipper-like transcriptional regulator 1 homolog n=1 Tax=Lepisosteus oculatus TaxID=7918 RepID=UPI0035F52F3E